mmetsp:Transcript_26634/g.74446  ORF Transcript_26634/g.74446 Transcript_26634/m.74446 type:complete len:346 (+) Transcript_26634:131-1168(+)|eukprot:CAMPEP_0119133628 /NCGR_PEP_ID=MMETSP1310-20130426/13473_1 /TAXON_ID=464262 /ORGANISM="Genus nov. species nov., Strain RCC2339" /LENGTH=345 /DNA_ID=CAMNT_0007124327 /DNA_START=65 /DNA_END=1102 /DNA_ORIENTATION=-
MVSPNRRTLRLCCATLVIVCIGMVGGYLLALHLLDSTIDLSLVPSAELSPARIREYQNETRIPLATERRGIVLFTRSRTASNYVMSMLSSHRQITLQRHMSLHGSSSEEIREFLMKMSAALNPHAMPKHVQGFTMDFSRYTWHFLTQREAPLRAMGYVLQNSGARAIVLSRRNKIRQVLSWLTVHCRGVPIESFVTGKPMDCDWNAEGSRGGVGRESEGPVYVNPHVVQFFLHMYEQVEMELMSFLTKLGLEMLVVYYEDMLVDRERTFGNMLQFMGLDPQDAATLHSNIQRLHPVTTRDLPTMISNFREMSAFFANTRYGHLFYSNETSPIDQQNPLYSYSSCL